MLTAYTRTFEADRAALEATHPGQFLDVYHDEFVANPWRVLEQLYALRDMPLQAEARQRMQAWLDNHPRGKHGLHRYRLEDYAITRDEVAALFEDYMQRYDLTLDEEATV